MKNRDDDNIQQTPEAGGSSEEEDEYYRSLKVVVCTVCKKYFRNKKVLEVHQKHKRCKKQDGEPEYEQEDFPFGDEDDENIRENDDGEMVYSPK